MSGILDEQALKNLIRETIREELAAQRPPDEIMSKTEVAELLGCTTRTIGNYMAREGLPYEHRGNLVVFRRSKVLEWHLRNGRKPLSRSA